jgi:hypothetical protein
MFRQVQEQIEGLGIQRDQLPVSLQRAGAGVNFASLESKQALTTQHLVDLEKN